jgi:hypothetical protein
MKKFAKIEEYDNDYLIIIVYEVKDLWQKEAVEYAKHLLKIRGITDVFAQKRIKELESEIEALWQIELEERRNESYGALGFVLIALFWFHIFFLDWDLSENGYVKKRKQKLFAVSLGILFYFLIVLVAASSYDQEKLNEIDRLEYLDSVVNSKIDWSGKYIKSFITSRRRFLLNSHLTIV